ncbi:MAG TPA: ferritin-like domain-containing protein [Roseiarcus sp.]|nr:ferritin-like domain-containing protein [Roseiarcus sp.]
MGLFSKDIQNLNDLFIHQLQDIFYAEKQIVKNLPTMIDKATSPGLKQGLSSHLRETEEHVERLRQVFEMNEAKEKAVDCPAIDGIIEEANDVISEAAGEEVRDAALTAAAQAVEHYEISRYGTLVAWAKMLGRDDCASLLEETLKEEKAADKKLTQLATDQINLRAA